MLSDPSLEKYYEQCVRLKKWGLPQKGEGKYWGDMSTDLSLWDKKDFKESLEGIEKPGFHLYSTRECGFGVVVSCYAPTLQDIMNFATTFSRKWLLIQTDEEHGNYFQLSFLADIGGRIKFICSDPFDCFYDMIGYVKEKGNK